MQVIKGDSTYELPPELLALLRPDEGEVLTDLVSDSRQAGPGTLFFALRGLRTDGHRYLQQVADAGAVAAVVESKDPAVDILQIEVPDSTRALALASAYYYDTAVGDLPYIAVTGTAGKTTTATMLASMLQALLGPVGLITTAGIYHPQYTKTDMANTTPDIITLHKTVKRLLELGSSALVIEASSHGIEQQRIGGLPFRYAVFTNLSNEHLDYHKTMEAYADTKARLFSELPADGVAVVNLCDPWTARILADCQARIIGFALAEDLALLDETEEGAALLQRCEHILTADRLETAADGTLSFELSAGGTKVHAVKSQVIGSFNVNNLMAASGVALAMGYTLEELVDPLESFRGVVGRQERVDLGQGYRVMLDFAHTPAALRNLLTTVRPLTDGKLYLVLAVAGDRDRVKRPEMAKIAAEYADHIFLTLQKTGIEPPQQIIADLREGLEGQAYEVLAVRPEAIRAAINAAEADDLVVIIGLMSPDHIRMGGRDLPYNDRTATELAIVERQMREILEEAE